MIDLHLHILANVDDGPSARADSLAMLDLASTFGYRTLVATPHFHEPSEEYLDRVNDEFAWLQPETTKRSITLLSGFEVRINPALPDWLQLNLPISLAGSNTILVELPFAGWPNYTERVVFDVMALGYRVLLAHPERYESALADPGLLLTLRERGVLMQITTGSLAGLFGRGSKAMAETMLREGQADILASDAHSAGRRFVSVSEGLDRARELVGIEGVELMTTTNPAAILANQPVLPIAQIDGAERKSHRKGTSRVRHLIPGW